MQILEIIASVDPAGGGPIEGILRQDEACRNAGIGVSREIVTLDAPQSPYITKCQMPVHALGRAKIESALPWRRFENHWRYSPAFIPWIKQNHAKYDAIIVNGLWNYASFAPAQVLPRLSTPYFVFTHGMLDPWLRHTYPVKHLVKQGFWLAGEGRLLAGARSVFFTCEEERQLARGQFWGHSYRETVVDYGASAPPVRSGNQEAAFRNAVPSLADRSYFLYLGRIHPKKGCDLLVEAFAAVCEAHPNIDLVVAGPDQVSWRPTLEALASKLNVQNRVHWPGPLYDAAKWGAILGAEAFILPSHQENFGIAVAEALACGVPVLVSNKVNIWREIEEAGAGIVESDTSIGTRRLLSQWFDLSNEAKETMREAASAVFKQRFDVAQTGPALVETIRRLL